MWRCERPVNQLEIWRSQQSVVTGTIQLLLKLCVKDPTPAQLQAFKNKSGCSSKNKASLQTENTKQKYKT